MIFLFQMLYDVVVALPQANLASTLLSLISLTILLIEYELIRVRKIQVDCVICDKQLLYAALVSNKDQHTISSRSFAGGRCNCGKLLSRLERMLRCQSHRWNPQWVSVDERYLLLESSNWIWFFWAVLSVYQRRRYQRFPWCPASCRKAWR